MKLIKITTIEQLDKLHDLHMIGNGTYSTGKFALEQGKPIFAAVLEEYDG